MNENIQHGIQPEVILMNALSERLKRNPHYSARAFARSLGVSHTLLSLILSKKRSVSKKLAKRMIEKLELPGTELAYLMAATRNGFVKRDVPASTEFEQISLDTFAIVSDWYHYAILSLLELPKSKLDVAWISRKLGITKLDAKLAIERLKRLGIIAQTNGKWAQVGKPIKLENTKAHAAIQKHYQQLLSKASEALSDTAFEERDFSSMTFAMDPQFIPYAKKRIQSFRRSLVEELEKMGPPKEVYHLTVQIYPVTKKEKKQ